MVMAFILATVKSGAEREALDKLRKVPEIKEAALLYGEYDLLLKIELDGISELTDFILEKVRGTGVVERTTTLIVAS